MIVVVGLSHKTAPIEVREQAAMDAEAVEEVLAALVAGPAVGEAMVVSTCNRVEILAAAKDPLEISSETVTRSVQDVLIRRVPLIRSHLYQRQGPEALTHLFRVASSLDSLVLGEPQILGQVKGAFEQAKAAGTIGSSLNRAVGHALRAAKRVRSETTVGAGQVSVPSVAVDLARQIFGDLRGRSAALIGSGAMGEAAAKLLAAAGAELNIVGRNQTRVAELASQLGGRGRSLDQLDNALAEVDVIVSATGASSAVITKEAVTKVRRKRRGRNLFLIDLAVPRDIDPRIDKLEGMFLYNVDDLSQIVSETLSSREKEAQVAEQIIRAETEKYGRALSAEQVKPTIVALRQHFGAVLREELERSLKGRLKHLGVEERDALEKMQEAALNKLLHPASRKLRQAASDELEGGDAERLVSVLRGLFPLDSVSQTRTTDGPGPSNRPPGVDSVPPAAGRSPSERPMGEGEPT